ncbi:hypothetical protein GCK72_000222 [Caenorhabditis remanei]|uniref:RING-type domain-containing protein n=1 Tax=Caenorhabditis remanei TaxID=31234 RepID=A0A6A5HJQ0_CAERE|nr:hypothetical protein GCK72_000222 [Caenorhabditis remanei]KAF1768410.1 hypothetical protein GCK72_000222 [Caenorhabditis remanei]
MSEPTTESDVSGSISRKEDGFKIFDKCDALGMMNDMIAKISRIGNVSREESQTLLGHYNWKDDLLLTMLNDADKSLIQKICTVGSSVYKTGECAVCSEQKYVTGFGCSHFACCDCWKLNFSTRIDEGSSEIECVGCQTVCSLDVVKHFSNENSFQKFEENGFQNFLECVDIKKCPSEKCPKYWKRKTHLSNRVICQYNIYHCPMTCRQLAMWNMNKEVDEESSKWLDENSKQCPKCSVSIEKASGCNHMKCLKCKHSFCYICLLNYSKDHNGCSTLKNIRKKWNDLQNKKDFFEFCMGEFKKFEHIEKDLKGAQLLEHIEYLRYCKYSAASVSFMKLSISRSKITRLLQNLYKSFDGNDMESVGKLSKDLEIEIKSALRESNNWDYV